MTRAEQQQQWENRIEKYRASAQSVKKWCAENNVKPSQLWYWLRKFKTNDETEISHSNQWLQVEVRDYTPMDNALLVRVGDACIEVKPGFDPALLSQVVRTLATC